MIQKVVHKKELCKCNSIKDDLKYWLNKSPEERISAVELLRRQNDGTTARLQRVAKVIQRT